MKRFVSLLVAGVAVGCSGAKQAPPEGPVAAPAPALKVEVVPVSKRKVPKLLTLTGSVLASAQSEVAANVSGRVVATHVERGQRVKQGQVLAAVDSRAAGLSASAAAAQSQVAETQVEQAQRECDRADKLLSESAISRAEYDRLKTQCTAQLHSAKAARANAQLASKLAADAYIRAPFDGTVGERYVNVGEYVQPPTRVATIVDVDSVRIQISVPESAVGLVREGQPLEVHVAAYPSRAFPATVKYVSPALRPATRDLVIEALAPNPDGALRPGMFTAVKLEVGEEELPTVPLEALRTEGTVRRLFLARDGQAVELVVRTGVARDGWVALYEHLTDADRVVLRPPSELRDGVAIQ